MFANDCVVYQSITNTFDYTALQNDLKYVQERCDGWLMTLNLVNVNSYLLTTVAYPFSTTVLLLTSPLNLYLYNTSVYPAQQLTWQTRVNTVISSANETLRSLKHYLRNTP